MATKTEILDAAIDVLRDGAVLTLNAVARQVEMTKPGVVHHFATKEVLTVAVVDRVLDLWEEQLWSIAGEHADSADRLRAYVEYSLLGDFDPSDLALMADARLRDRLAEQWVRRLDPWFGASADDPRVHAVRLLADGAWFDRSLGVLSLSRGQREAILAVADGLVDEAART